jgi:hypothetical protein
VGGDLYLTGCTGLTTLAGMGSVGGALNISGCAGLTWLSDIMACAKGDVA